MTATYLDTSAIMRLILQEGDFQPVDQAMNADPTSSVLTRVEIRAGIFKRWRDGDFSLIDRDTLLAFVSSNTIPPLTWLPLNAAVLSEAGAIVESHAVRSLDALHLATAVVADRNLSRRGDNIEFCTADRHQAEAARAIFGAARVQFVPPWR